jgi:hypothetical protein
MKPTPQLKLPKHGTPITIEYGDRTIKGTFGVWAGRITVYAASGKNRSRKAAEGWGSDTLQMIAASILRVMAMNGEA